MFELLLDRRPIGILACQNGARSKPEWIKIGAKWIGQALEHKQRQPYGDQHRQTKQEHLMPKRR
jgi:hypothetical protein